MFLLDTNIVSLLDNRRRSRFPELVAWLEERQELLSISVVTIAELRVGQIKLARRGQTAREAEVRVFIAGIERSFASRTLSFDVPVAHKVAELQDHVRPLVIEPFDLVIAATAAVHNLTILTNNIRHFAPTGVPVLDPLAGLPPSPA